MAQLCIAIGFIGIFINLTAYGLLSTGRLASQDMRYQCMNIAGTLAILISFLAQWNLPSFLANVAWLMIGIVSLARLMLRRKRGAR